ncbi:MAG: hypothetical protein ACTTJH_00630 [Bacteroidales bacterium]
MEEIKNREKGLSVREKLNSLINAINKGIEANDNYTTLKNKPQINSVQLEGNKTLEQLGIVTAITEAINSNNREYYTKDEITQIITEAVSSLDGSSVTSEDLKEFVTEDRVKELLKSYGETVSELTKNVKQKIFKKCDVVGDGECYLRDSRAERVYSFEKETSSIYLNGVRYFPDDWEYKETTGLLSFVVADRNGDRITVKRDDDVYLEAYFS